MSKYLDRAKEIRAIVEPHHNCTQSVLMSFTQSLNLDDETAYKIAVAFGAGMKSGLVCGVITGGLMVLGLAGVDDVKTVNAFCRKIRNNHDGTLMCSELLRMNAERGGEKKPHCDAMVYEAVELLEEILA